MSASPSGRMTSDGAENTPGPGSVCSVKTAEPGSDQKYRSELPGPHTAMSTPPSGRTATAGCATSVMLPDTWVADQVGDFDVGALVGERKCINVALGPWAAIWMKPSGPTA